MLKRTGNKFILSLLGILLLASCGKSNNDRAWIVPMVRVISTPDFFDGEYVFTRGYLSKNGHFLHFSLESRDELDTLSAIALFTHKKIDDVLIPDECFSSVVEVSGIIEVAVLGEFNGPTYKHIYTIESFPAGSCYISFDR